MGGIYIHIPYCRKACHYCNFHFSTSLNGLDDMVDCITLELAHRHTFLKDRHIDTIYFGGGTPSLLSPQQVEKILNALARYFSWSNEAEITMECNPEDLSIAYCQEIKQLGINRLSIGLQSFDDGDLQYMNRVHSAAQSLRAIQYAQKSDFQTINIDLMFGLVESTLSQWEQNLEIAASLGVSHISCYNLTIEEQTVFSHRARQHQLNLPDDELQWRQFCRAHDFLQAQGYEHYEISNYAMPGHRAQHNTNYWERKPYLGLGPSAHSFRDNLREWNINHNPKYVKNWKGEIHTSPSRELLTEADIYNETIMLRLRTAEGLRQSDRRHWSQQLRLYYEAQVAAFVSSGEVRQEDERYYLPLSSWYKSDAISGQLFWVED